MGGLIRRLIEYRAIVLVIFVASLLVGCYAYTKLDIEAYPDPSPPLVEIITQNPAWSAEEMEQQVTIPVENAIYGSPHLEQVRSTSIFGLSDVKLYFSFESDYFHDREEVLYHLQTLTLPNNPNIKILAATVSENKNDDTQPAQPLYDDFTGRKPIVLRDGWDSAAK